MYNCPICCLADVGRFRTNDNDELYEFKCGRCGRFLITDELLRHLQYEDLISSEKGLSPYLAAYIRKQNGLGEIPRLDTMNWQKRANWYRHVSVSQKTRNLLEVLASRSQCPGQETHINLDLDYPLLAVSGPEEFVFFFRQLKERGLLTGTIDGGIMHSMLTIDGWSFLEPGAGSGIPGRCFIAMSFHPDLESAYRDGILPAVHDDCGMDPVRVDKEEHNEKICDKIIAEIRLAQFLVADVTQHKAGVYFESGFAMGLGRPVIWLCQEDDLCKAHFDTRQYNHIVWTDPADLRQKLKNRIQATIVKTE